MNKLQGLGRFEQLVRKSRFVAIAGPIDRVDESHEFLKRHGLSNCQHVCWAYRVHSRVRYDDAGEPSGCAGRPIFNAIDQLDLDHTMVVVNRFFGGIKLGTGGLARAFSSAAHEAIESAIRASGIKAIIAMQRLTIVTGFEQEAAVRQLLLEHQGMAASADYLATGLVLQAELPTTELQSFQTELAESTRGQAEMRLVDSSSA
ncbi:MAG: YigZ family protein [Pseudomonadota bacterium]